jgi:hypothetical protein
LLPSANNVVSSVPTLNGSLLLPPITAANIGEVIGVRNNGPLTAAIYPSLGQHIDANGVNAPISLPAGITAEFLAATGNQWNQISPPTPGGPSLGYAFFWQNVYAAPIAIGAAFDFATSGPAGGFSNIVRSSPGNFVLPAVGTYKISWQAGITEAGQMMVSTTNLGLVPSSVASRATGTAQITNTILLSTTVSNDVLSIINPPGNASALTVTPASGSLTHAPATSLVIERLA